MVVGVISWELRIHGSRSLKEKRSVVRSIRDRLRARFNAAVNETGLQDSHDRAELTAAVIATEAAGADAQLDSMDRFVAGSGRAVVARVRRELY